MHRSTYSRSHTGIIITGLALAGALTAKAAGPTPLFIEAKGVDNYNLRFIRKAGTAPVIDGKLDDPPWQGIEPNTDFGFCEYGARRYAAPKTEFKYLWDDTYLYVAFTCYEDTAENLGRVKVADMDKSKRIYVRDCMELHIDGNNGRTWSLPLASGLRGIQPRMRLLSDGAILVVTGRPGSSWR